MGDYDHVPQAVRQAGGEIVFHKLPVRPGKPILGAATAAGQLIVGLPGNPVSAAVGGRRFVVPWLRVLAGGTSPPPTTLTLIDAPAKTLPLHWMRLVQLQEGGRGALVASRGSGDLVSLAGSSGFIEQPPEASGLGPWPYWPWSVED
jgi:molybdopterin biosynthesis enzyme